VQSVQVGSVEVPGPELFWMAEFDEWFPLALQVVVIRDGDTLALVNTGPPPDLTQLNALWVQLLGERGRLHRSPEEELVPALASVGVAPEDVTHVVCTPFQLYSTGNIPLFANAQICLSKRGWIHYHTTHDHPHDARWNSISKEVLVHLVTDAWDRVRLLEDEDEIVPGIRTWFSGTHHRASVAVEVDTDNGVVVISDSFFYYENVEDGRLLGINENMYEALATNKRALAVAQHIVPLYDPKVFERYPGGRIA
jgi:hypothetical protein